MSVSWEDMCDPGLPDHDTEVMSAHQGQPSVAVQNATHGAPAPAPDRGGSNDYAV